MPRHPISSKRTKVRGRPKGRRNDKTLLQEEALTRIVKRAEGYLVHEISDILVAICKKAKEGDVAAAKLILDRVLPAKRATDNIPSGVEIIVNVGGYDGNQVNQGNGGQNGRQAERTFPGIAEREEATETTGH